MEPITAALLGAIGAGVLSGAKEVGKQATVDAYQGLKALLVSRFGDTSEVAGALARLEAKPESEGHQAVLGEELAAVDAASYADITQAAERLLAEVGQLGGGTVNVQNVNGDNNVVAGAGANVSISGRRD